jgi:tetratricopeptide (TPR) repeat protein
MQMRLFIAVFIVALLSLPAAAEEAGAPPASVTQREDQLDLLFGKLKDPSIGADAMRVEAQIWSLWMEAGTPRENELLMQATAAMGVGGYELSEQTLNTLISQTPRFSEAFNKRATLYYLMGRYEESLADIVKVLDLEPRHFGALSGRGMVYQRLGRKLDALAAYREALEVNPHLPGARVSVQELEKLEPDL